ncbi:hypothetical protein [Piscinibacter sp.]|uniref:hypothetical protein n=1 Tax=Piscinibacter sp. TaxID=1903157 RepID=UPI0039E6A48F
MSERAQAIMIWWGLAFMYIFGFTLWGLLKMMPPPSATLTADQVAAFYADNSLHIRLGAMVASWTSAFMVPFSTVVAIQMARLERGRPVWAVLAFAGGIMMSIFLVIPGVFWGVAAYTPTRPAEVTALMHELALLTLTTTDQYYIFQMVSLAFLSLTHKGDVPDSPFPRWIGYFTLWAALAFEVGAFAFLPKSGPFSWNGAVVYWMPLTVFGAWVTTVSVAMLRALKRQAAAKMPQGAVSNDA